MSAENGHLKQGVGHTPYVTALIVNPLLNLFMFSYKTRRGDFLHEEPKTAYKDKMLNSSVRI